MMAIMKRSTKQFLRGVGSVVDVLPNNSFRRFIRTETAAQRMSGHWQRVGNSIGKAIAQHEHGQRTKKQAS